MLLATVVLTTSAALFASQSQSTTPSERISEAWWNQRHEEKVALTSSRKADLAFLGDSITHGWETTGRQTWDKYYSHRNAANFGFSGDQTQHVLWRLANGELIGMQPKVVVIMIGTNNIGNGQISASDTAVGVAKIVRTLQASIPKVKILLLSIFPRGMTMNDNGRVRTIEASRWFQSLADPGKVVCLDIGKYFLNRSGDIRVGLMPDLLHPNEKGYEIWAMAMERELAGLIGDAPIPH